MGLRGGSELSGSHELLHNLENTSHRNTDIAMEGGALISVTVIKHLNQSNLGRKGLTIAHSSRVQSGHLRELEAPIAMNKERRDPVKSRESACVLASVQGALPFSSSLSTGP